MGAHTVTVNEAAAMLAKTAGDSYAAGWNAGQRAAYLAEWERCDFALWAEVLFGVHPDDAGDTEFAEYLAEEWARLRLLAIEGAPSGLRALAGREGP